MNIHNLINTKASVSMQYILKFQYPSFKKLVCDKQSGWITMELLFPELLDFGTMEEVFIHVSN